MDLNNLPPQVRAMLEAKAREPVLSFKAGVLNQIGMLKPFTMWHISIYHCPF
jgi:hypothetical protein